MRREKWFLAIGFVIGSFLSVVLLLYVAPRYTVVRTEDTVVKQDTWSGKSWCLVNESWKPLAQQEEGWMDVDRALSKALNISYVPVDIEEALRGLRENYPVLKDVPTRELLQRIKVIYSNKLLCSLYLKSFMELHGKKGEGEGK